MGEAGEGGVPPPGVAGNPAQPNPATEAKPQNTVDDARKAFDLYERQKLKQKAQRGNKEARGLLDEDNNPQKQKDAPDSTQGQAASTGQPDSQADGSNKSAAEESGQPEKSNWHERRNETQKAWDKRLTGYQELVRQNLDNILPSKDSPGYQEAKERLDRALMELGRIDSGDAKDYNPDNGFFTNSQNLPDNDSIYQKIVVDAVRRAVKEGRIKSQDYDPELDARFVTKKVADSKGDYVDGYVVNTEAIPEDNILLAESLYSVRSLIKTLINKESFKGQNKAYLQLMLEEYLMIKHNGLSADVKFQLINDAYKFVESITGTKYQGLVDSSPIRENQVKVAVRTLRNAKGEEGDNAFVSWMTEQFKSKAKVGGNNINVEQLNALKKAFFGENLDANSWDVISKLEQASMAYQAKKDSKIGNLFGLLKTEDGRKIDVNKLFNINQKSGLNNLELTGDQIQDITLQIFGSSGLNEEALTDLSREFNHNFLKDYQEAKKLGISWETWSFGMMFLYSIFGPIMTEGEEEER